jgi:hypothetical protein
VALRHTDSGSRVTAPIWFAKYAALFVLPLLFLAVAFREHDGWFLGLSAYWAVSIAFLAWRKAKAGPIGWGWCGLLALVMVGSWAYCAMLVLAVPGDTQICYDRVMPTTRGSAGVNLGPSPFCEGTPLQDVQTE